MNKCRLMVLMDTLKSTRYERRISNDFDKWLFKNGYSPFQAGVLTRIANSRANAEALPSRLRAASPDSGFVRLFVLTETQFQGSMLLTGVETPQEEEIGSQLDIFL